MQQEGSKAERFGIVCYVSPKNLPNFPPSCESAFRDPPAKRLLVARAAGHCDAVPGRVLGEVFARDEPRGREGFRAPLHAHGVEPLKAGFGTEVVAPERQEIECG